MNHVTSKGLLAHILQLAKDDSGGRRTGWCEMGDLSCAYYPESKRHTYFLVGEGGVVNTTGAEQWLIGQLNLSSKVPA